MLCRLRGMLQQLIELLLVSNIFLPAGYKLVSSADSRIKSNFPFIYSITSRSILSPASAHRLCTWLRFATFSLRYFRKNATLVFKQSSQTMHPSMNSSSLPTSAHVFQTKSLHRSHNYMEFPNNSKVSRPYSTVFFPHFRTFFADSNGWCPVTLHPLLPLYHYCHCIAMLCPNRSATKAHQTQIPQKYSEQTLLRKSYLRLSLTSLPLSTLLSIALSLVVQVWDKHCFGQICRARFSSKLFTNLAILHSECNMLIRGPYLSSIGLITPLLNVGSDLKMCRSVRM